MVRLTVSPEVSRPESGGTAAAGGGALTSILVQAGKAKIELAVLKNRDTWQVLIRQLTPDLTEVGESAEQAKALRQEHDDLVTKLNIKQREFAAVLTKTPKSGSEDGVPEVSIQSLADAWKDVNKQMEYRRMLLDQSVAFHSSAQQFASKMDQVEAQCAADVQSHDVDAVRRLLQQHQDLKKGVLEASMSTLQEGQLLLERIRKVALCAGVQSRHATTSACHAIERLLQLLQDKWRRLDELWYRRWIQLQQCVQMAQVDQEGAKARSWLDTVGEAYIGKRELGDSLDSAYSLQEECLSIEAEFSELPTTVRRLVDTAEYLVHSALPMEGECGAARQKLTALLRRIDDFGKMFAVRRKNVTQAAQFFSLAQVATVKLQEIESQLSRPNMADRHGYLASAIVDISTVALHCGRTLMARIGKNIPTAKGIETTLAALEEKCSKLESMCVARHGKTDKPNETVLKLHDNITKFTSWLNQVGEAVVTVNFDSGSNLQTAQDFLELHQNLACDIKVKLTEMKTQDRFVDELAASAAESDVAASKDAAAKLKALNEQFNKLNAAAERRLKLANSLVTFHKRVQQLTTQMDLLELHLKLEKLDPAQVPDASIAQKDEAYKKMNVDWTEVEKLGQQFLADCKEPAGEDNRDLDRTMSSVEFLLAHLSDRKAILTDFVERWKVHVNSGKEFKTQWQQFVKDARQTIDWIMKVENDFFPEIAGELGTNMNQVKHHQKRLEDFKPNIMKAKEETEKHLRTAELLSLKGDTHGQRDQIVNDLLKVHTRFLARLGEYRFLLSMSEKFFANLDQLDELIKKTEKAYASEELPKEVAAAQVALREHYDSRTGLQQFINFASEEADQIVVRVRQQDSEALARDEVQRVLQSAEDKRNAWDKAWQDQKIRLDQNFQACQFYFDLKQLQNLLDELQRQLDMRRGNYGNSLSSAEMIVKSFQAFLGLADAVEGRMREFMGTADRMVRDKHYDSRRIRHEVDETDRRWKTFYNSIKNYEGSLADSMKFFKSWDECEGWISDAAQFLLGISREAPHCTSTEDVDRLIKKIEAYRLEGYKEQDGRLNAMDRIVTDLYGSVHGPEKLQPLLDKNQEMFNAFVKAVEELAVLRNNLNKTEQILASMGAVVEKKAPRQPRFVQPLQNAEIVEGHGVTFECRLECDTAAPMVEWLKDGMPMSRGTTVFKDGLCRLTIDIANAGDSATYTCKVTTSAGNVESSATLKVKEAQQKVVAPIVSGQLKSVDAPEGTSLTLECYLSGTPYPTVTWYKDGVALADSADYSITVGNNGGEPCTLRIRRLNPAVHGGVYTIKAVNPGGEVSSSATVTVISIQKPEFVEPLKDETVQEGKAIRLECKYIGEPAPQIQWLFNEIQILPSAMFKITVDVGSTALEMREVFSEDCGTYTAVARNLGGEARTTCRVGLVETTLSESAAARAGARRPVRPQFFQPLEDLIVQEGNRIKLECVLTGYPEPEITWLHNGNPVKKSKDVDMFFDNGNCSLVIYEVYLEDAGEYVCVAKNEHGSTQTSCRMIVEPLGDLSEASASGDVPPKFTQLLKDIEGTEGELVRFECRVIGHPTPIIKWYRGRTQIDNSPEFQILSERELQALTIPMLCKDDAGNYMVKANNDAGQAKCYATLIVKPASDRHAMKMRLIESCHSVTTSVIEGCSAPVITKSFRDLHARPGDPCTMEVTIEGTPKPKVHWLFNNELISASDYQVHSFGDVYSLHIPAVADRDAGRFSVIADNAAGKAWCSALLVVVEASQLMDDLGSPPETPLGSSIQPTLGPMPLFSTPAKPAAAPPRFADQLRDFTVEEGATVTLECRVAGHPEPVVRWYKEGRPMTGGPGFEIRKQGDRAWLTLFNAAERDSGRYTCIAQNPAGENSTSSTLIVNASSVPPQFVDKPRTQRVREGQTARFVTRVAGHPAPEVTWFREGVPIVNSPDFAISSQGDNHYLDIAEVFYEDAGKFAVQVSNSAGRVQCAFDLSVEPTKKDAVSPLPVVAPQFTKPLSNQRAHVGQRVTLECALPPYTQPDQVNWYRNEVFLELTPDSQQSYRDGVCQLTIPCVSVDQAGRYTCVIVLRGASNSTDMYLEVVPEERRPEAEAPHFDDKMRNVEMTELGHDAVFVCHLTGRPPPNIQWYHDDQLIRPSKKHEMKLTKDGVCSLRVKAVTPDDAGQYTCVANNLAGQQSCFAQLALGDGAVDETSYVSQDTLRRLMGSPGRFRDGDYGGVSEQYFKPVFRKVPADLEVPEGHLARFDCIVAGRPTPDVKWYRDGTEVYEDRLHKIVINEEGISSLIIDATSNHDAGLYTCIARNRGGEDRFQVRLNVMPRPTASPPRFLSRLTNQTVHVGQSVTFEAEVTGVPVPMLSWQKDNSHIVGSEHYQIQTEGCRSTLYIPSVRPDDDAWYQCTAASVSGTSTNRVRLVVQVEARTTPTVQRPVSASFTDYEVQRSSANLKVSATPPPSRSSPWQQQTESLSREGLSRVETVTRTQTISPAMVRVEATGVAAPRLLEPMRDQHLNDGAMAHFWCKIQSSVPPTCDWFHDNQPLQLSDKHRIANNPRDGDYALMVFDVRPRDAGVYKCVVSNPGGEVTCIAHLHVESMHGRLSRVEHTAVGSSPGAGDPIIVMAPETVVSQTWTQQQQHHVQRTVTSSQSSAPAPQAQAPQKPPAAVGGEAPRFVQPLQDVTAADGSEVTLTCQVTGRPAPASVSWFHNDRCIDRSTDFAISFDERTGRAELVIVDCMADDHGQFRCVATTPVGTAETRCKFVVLTNASPYQPQQQQQQQQQPSMTAAQQLFDVDMSEEFRNATAQLQQSAPPTSGTVQQVAAADGQAPKFVQPIQPCVVVEGDTCTFSAVVSGDPIPDVAWLKEKQDLVLTDRHVVQADPTTGRCSLTIRTCSAADTGVYSCRASNTSGRATCTANVVVVPPNVEVTVTEKTTSIKKEKVTMVGDQETRVVENSPTFTESLQPVTEVNEGTHVRLQCRYCAEPPPSVTWRFNGVQLSSSNRITLTADANQSTLVINAANMADTGEYVCTAVNALGEAATKTFLRVRKPEGDTVPPIQSVQPSSSTIDQYPAAGSIPIASGSAFEVASSLLPRLPIGPMPLADPCTIIANQKMLQHPQPPRFMQSLHNQVVPDGERVVFTVQFDGYPKPVVQWLINGSPVKSGRRVVVDVDERVGTSTLTVEKTTAACEGEYVCKAENSIGTAFTTSHLFVVARSMEARRSGESTQMMISAYARPKPVYLDVATASSSASTSTLFSAKIQAERPEPIVMRTDASHRIPVTNVFIPIAVAEKHGIDALAQHHRLVEAADRKLICFAVPTATQPNAAGKIFSETVAIDTGDRDKSVGRDGRIVEFELKKLKRSTLNVEQKALPQGYRMIAEIAEPQTFSETIAVDAGDHRPYEIELLKKKTSVMDVERKALPRGVRMEAEVLPPAQKTSLVYIARSKCAEAILHREECYLNLGADAAAPVFVEKLQPMTQAMDGAKVTLACRVVGRPMPETVTWLRDGRPIKTDNPDYGRGYDPTTGQARLSIHEVFPEDAGLFECVAENPYGKATTQAELLVEAYEYVADSEESRSVSSLSMSSAFDTLPMLSDEYAQTVAEALLEEVRVVERGYEDTIQTADVKWCVPDLIVPLNTELAAEFRPEKPDATDGRQVSIEHRGTELTRPRVTNRTQAMVGAQTARFGEERLSTSGIETVVSATQQVVEAPSGDRATKKIVGETRARPEPIDDMFGREPSPKPLSAVCGEDRADEKVTSPLESAPGMTHPACWTFPQVETTSAEVVSDAGQHRVPSPQSVAEPNLIGYNFERSTVGLSAFSRVCPTAEYHSEGEEEDLWMDAAEPSSPHPVDVAEDALTRATVRARQSALTTTLRAFTEPEIVQPVLDEVVREQSRSEEYGTTLTSANRVPPTPSRVMTQLAAVSLNEETTVAAAASSVPETGREPTIASVDLEPGRVGRAKPSLSAPIVELVVVHGTSEFEAKLEGVERPAERDVVDEFCRTSRRPAEERPLTKVRAVVELVPQEKMAPSDDGIAAGPEFGNESVVSVDLERARQDGESMLTRVRQQTAVTGAERIDDLGVDLEVHKTSESLVVDAELQTRTQAVGYPVAHVVGIVDRRSPEKITDHVFEIPTPETGRELVVESSVEKATMFGRKPSLAVPQLQQLDVHSANELNTAVEHQQPAETEVSDELSKSNVERRPLTKVMAVIELVGQERMQDAGEQLPVEYGNESVVASDLERAASRKDEQSRVRQQTSVIGVERADDLGVDVEVHSTAESVVDDVKLQTRTPAVGYPVAYVFGIVDRRSPEKLVEHVDDVPTPESGREVIVELESVDKATVFGRKHSLAVPQLQLLDVHSAVDLDVAFEHERPAEIDISDEMSNSSVEHRPVTKVIAVIELIGQERMQDVVDDEVPTVEYGQESVVEAETVIAEHQSEPVIKELPAVEELLESINRVPEREPPARSPLPSPDEENVEFECELAADLDVEEPTVEYGQESVVEAETIIAEHQSEPVIKELPAVEELLEPIKRAPEREPPARSPWPSPDEEIVEFECELAADLDDEEPIGCPATQVVEESLAEAKIIELEIFLEELIIEEIVIDVRKLVQLEQHDASLCVACEENSSDRTTDIEVEEMSVIPDIVDVQLCNADVAEIEMCSFSEETMTEEIVIEVTKTIVESEIALDVADGESRKSYSDTVSLPQTIIHHVEATARLQSPAPAMSGAELALIEEDQLIDHASMDEWTVYQQDEETFDEMVLEQKTEFETMTQVLEEQTKQLEARKSYSDTVSLPQTIIHHVEATARLQSPAPAVSGAELALIEEDQLIDHASIDEWTVYQQDEETFDEMVVEQKTEFETMTQVQEAAHEMTWSAPVFTVPLYNVTAIDGHSATLECHVTGSPRPTVAWSVDRSVITESADIKMCHEEATGRCALVIGDVLPEDEGQYTVTAANRLGSASSSAYLTVQREVVKESEEEVYSSGEETTSTWTVENRKVFEEFKKLEIDVSLSRKGILSTEFDQQESRAPEAPAFVRELESLDVFESTPVKLECDVKGFPQPEITWYQDGKKMQPDDHVKFEYSNGRCALAIDRVRIDDEAEYICEARNAYGTASTYAELLVEKLIEGLEQMVVEEYYEVEIEMNFKWKDNRPKTPTKVQATIN